MILFYSIIFVLFAQLVALKSYAQDFEYPFYSNSKAPHEMQIVNNGLAALYKRFEMIDSAKKSIELEYFIFNPNASTNSVQPKR